MTYELPEGDFIGPYKWFSVDTLRAEVAKAERRGAAQRDADLMGVNTQPFLLFDAQQQTIHWPIPTRVDLPMTVTIPPMPLYTATQLAAARLQGAEELKRLQDINRAHVDSHNRLVIQSARDGERITALESALGVARSKAAEAYTESINDTHRAARTSILEAITLIDTTLGAKT